MRKAIRVACWTTVLTLTLVLVAVAFSYRYGEDRPPQPIQSSSQGEGRDRTEAELITLQQWGFEPKEINRPVGPFMAIFENRSGLRDVKLSLVRASGPEVRRIPVTRNMLNSRQRLELPPGTYVVKELNHPDWECRITITPASTHK